MPKESLRSLLKWAHEANGRGGNYLTNLLHDCKQRTDQPGVAVAAETAREAKSQFDKVYEKLVEELKRVADAEDP